VLAVVIEDLQWADQQSARALLFACRRLAADKVLVIVSARAQQLGRIGDGWTRFLTGDRRCSRLALARLSTAELAELAAASGRSGLFGRGLRRVADHRGGNPLFARAAGLARDAHGPARGRRGRVPRGLERPRGTQRAGRGRGGGRPGIYANASERECLRWARRSMQVCPGSVPPAVLGAHAMARAMAGEAAAALRMLCFLPGALALVPDAQADALTVRGLLRLWTGESGADDDLTAVVTRIKGGLRPRYPGQALGFLAEVAFRLGRWDEAQAHGELAVSMAEEAGRSCDLPFARNIACRVAALRGEWEISTAHARSAERAARAAGTGSAMVFAAAARAVLGFARDNPAEVLRGIPSSPAVPAAGPGEDPTVWMWRPLRIWALVRTGRLDEADAALDGFEVLATVGP
jgi:hypothetical protein